MAAFEQCWLASSRHRLGVGDADFPVAACHGMQNGSLWLPSARGRLAQRSDMGRNFPSATELVHEVIGELKPFSEMLPPADRWILNRFYEYALNNRAAIANAASLMPLEATLLIILLEERKRTNHAINELQAEIEKLKKEQKQLGPPAQTQDDGP